MVSDGFDLEIARSGMLKTYYQFSAGDGGKQLYKWTKGKASNSWIVSATARQLRARRDLEMTH